MAKKKRSARKKKMPVFRERAMPSPSSFSLSETTAEATVRVFVGQLGGQSQQVRLAPGTTLGSFLSSRGWDRLTARVNRRKVPTWAVLQDGDIVVAVPNSIRGEAARFAHLDMARLKTTLSPKDYEFFSTFVGADALGFTERDLLGSD
jgi:hypothetical protein